MNIQYFLFQFAQSKIFAQYLSFIHTVPSHLFIYFNLMSKDNFSSDVPQEYMNYFNVNDEILLIQDETMDSEEESRDLFDVANMEWIQYNPGVTDTAEAKSLPEPAVRRTMSFDSWKENRQEIVSMEVDHVAVRKATAKKLEE
ncbi:hypothetical protein BDC45DRAFT_499539 [Circinella umbellata]|nr:hypothetical protein BDC45DRAFT_499539 [Circinella umbellata]